MGTIVNTSKVVAFRFIKMAARIVGYVNTKLIPRGDRFLFDFALPKLTKFWSFAKVELAPPTPADIPAITKGLGDMVTKVKTATQNALVATEIGCLFFVGECIGKGSLVGYNIPGAANWGADHM